MRYLGGKFRIAKPLGAYLRGRLGGRVFCEPFCGALNVTVTQTGPRLAADASPYLFSLYRAVRRGWDPPTVVTEETYAAVKARLDPDDPLTAFIGYGCSFGGKFFGGYARPTRPSDDYAGAARRALLRDLGPGGRCAEATLACASYEVWDFGPRHLVYCDPPYAGTTGYGAVGAFDSAKFWARATEWTRAGAVVLVSEYSAPPEWAPVWSVQTKTAIHGAGRSGRIENLYELRRGGARFPEWSDALVSVDACPG